MATTLLDIKSQIIGLQNKFDQSRIPNAQIYMHKLQKFYDNISTEIEISEPKEWVLSNMALWENRFDKLQSYYAAGHTDILPTSFL